MLEDEERIFEKMAEHVEAGVVDSQVGEQASKSKESQAAVAAEPQVARDAEIASEEEEEDVGMEDAVDQDGESVDAEDVDRNQMLSLITETIAKISEEVDIAEIYSPPRVTSHALKNGMKTGMAMDLTTRWDVTIERHREAARQYLRRAKPALLIGLPDV